MSENNNKAVELTDEQLAKVVGGIGITLPNGTYSVPEECAACTLASAHYQDCDIQKSGSSVCKYNR